MSPGGYVWQLMPELILMIAAFAILLLGVGKHEGGRLLVGPLAMAAVLLALATTLLGHVENYDFGAPGLLFTSLTFYARLFTLLIGVLILMVNWGTPETSERGEFFSMLLLTLSGLMLTASANDLVVLFLAIELVSVPSYVLVAISRQDMRAPESAVKYFFLGAVAAAMLLYGFSFLYGVTGTATLYSADGVSIAARWSQSSFTGLAVVGFLLAFAGLAFKIAAVPFQAYLADVYEGAAAPVTGLLGFVPKFAGFLALAKLFAVIGWSLPAPVFWAIWLVAAATMTYGNVLALLQSNIKRLLAYSGIAHTGYMLVGLLAGPAGGVGPMRNGLAAVLFYVVIYGLMNLGAFALLASLRARGEELERIEDLAGLHRRHPGAALGFAILGFSLMGFPLTAGFLGKVYLFTSAFSVGSNHAYGTPMVVLGVIAVVNSAIGAAYYLRIAAGSYLRTPREVGVQSSGSMALSWSWVTCVALMLAFFFLPNGLMRQATRATAFLQVPEPVATSTLAEVDSR